MIPPAIIHNDEVATESLQQETDINDDNNRIVTEHTDLPKTQSQTYYEVEKIIAKYKINQNWPYRIKWINHSNKANTWVDYDDLNDNCKNIVKLTFNAIPMRKRKSYNKYYSVHCAIEMINSA
jgi:hypothetical protein